MTFDVDKRGILATDIPDDLFIKRGVTAKTTEFLTDDEIDELKSWLTDKKETEMLAAAQEKWDGLADEIKFLTNAALSNDIKITLGEIEKIESCICDLKEIFNK